MKKVKRLLLMSDGDERKHVLDYTNIDLYYVEDQSKNLLSKFISHKQELFSCKSELIVVKNTKAHNLSLQNEITRLNMDNESLMNKVSNLKKMEDVKGRKQFPQRKLCSPRKRTLPLRLYLRSPLTLSLSHQTPLRSRHRTQNAQAIPANIKGYKPYNTITLHAEREP
ncbi:hypothetical protein Tco_1132184 [Tanacetum coccineum]|uniref:Uncharacterized protein n=1 Tax=Tanacetum coccineum TaxID=301880 RepID=A0ABQ5JB98_9ASTR